MMITAIGTSELPNRENRRKTGAIFGKQPFSVEQRLKQVMVAAIDDGHGNAGAPQPARSGQPANPAPTITTCGSLDRSPPAARPDRTIALTVLYCITYFQK